MLNALYISIGLVIGIGLYLLPCIGYWNIGKILHRCTLTQDPTNDNLFVTPGMQGYTRHYY